jgi:hypothetical protein
MAEQAPLSNTDKANQIATSLEDAALKGDKGYREHMRAQKRFYDEYQAMSPEDRKVFTKTVEDKLKADKLFDLVCMEEAAEQLNLGGALPHIKGEISKKILTWEANSRELKNNPLLKDELDYLVQNYDKLRQMTKTFGFSHENLNADDINAAMRPARAIHNLFEKHNSDPCLYDKIKEKDGSISQSKVKQLLNAANDAKHPISSIDKDTLEWLRSQSEFFTINTDDLKKHLKDAGWSEFAQYVHAGDSGYTRSVEAPEEEEEPYQETIFIYPRKK